MLKASWDGKNEYPMSINWNDFSNFATIQQLNNQQIEDST